MTTDLFTASIVDALSGAVRRNVPLHAPEIAGNEWQYVKDCLDTGWVSSVGSYVDRFEEMLCAITGADHAVATNTGTAALHVCLILSGVEANQEVIVPSLTFVATANAVAYCGAVPHFADVDYATLGLDPVKLDRYLAEIGERTTAGLINRRTGRVIGSVVCMHTFGHPSNLTALSEVCDTYGLTLIEDAAEGLGSLYKGRHVGNVGSVSALSFNGNKIVTSGGGGAILTNDENLAKRAKHLTTTAKRPHKWAFEHDEIGYNYRLPNVSAAIGCAQLERLDSFLERKRRLAEIYAATLADLSGVTFVSEPPDSRSNYWLNTILLDADRASSRDAVLEALNQAGLMSRPAWTPMHRLPMFADCPSMDLAVTDDLFARIVNIPSSADLVEL